MTIIIFNKQLITQRKSKNIRYAVQKLAKNLFNSTQRITNDTVVRCRCVVTCAHSLALDYNYRVVVGLLIISLL